MNAMVTTTKRSTRTGHSPFPPRPAARTR
jgi:hypothetical protein